MPSHFSLNWKHDFFFSAGTTTLDNPSGICPIISLASPTTPDCCVTVSVCFFQYTPQSEMKCLNNL